MVARDERYRLDFVGFESAQIAVLHQVIRVLVMAFIADVHADVMEDGRVLEPFALAVGQAVDGAGLVEERHGQTPDMLRVIREVVAPLGEFEHAAAAHIRIAVGLRDFLAMTRDVVEHETFAQRQVA
jgi:hypothetical protein